MAFQLGKAIMKRSTLNPFMPMVPFMGNFKKEEYNVVVSYPSNQYYFYTLINTQYFIFF